ncbi:hypothetical protein [Pseudonocardia xishanensis]|uniref:Uncharacterized protein n=1 Tax=Pseudonocardia xishanensis TaxID=630995 RepID=A0ABP8S2X2_9PSEU
MAVLVCRDVIAHGHVDGTQAPAGEGRRSLSEEEKAARRVVVERNKQWRSATTVRREWLRAFAACKTAPVGAERFVLTCLLAGDHPIRQALEAGWPLLRELLGFEVGPSDRFRSGGAEFSAVMEMVSAVSPRRATVLAAAAVLCAWEERTGPHTWRHQGADTARYLGQMATWGYQLSDIETYAVTGLEPEAAAPEAAPLESAAGDRVVRRRGVAGLSPRAMSCSPRAARHRPPPPPATTTIATGRQNQGSR